MIRINRELEYKGATFASGMVIVLNVAVKKLPQDNKIDVLPQGVYVSDAPRQADPEGNATQDYVFPRYVSVNPYNRAEDGADVMMLAHEAYKSAIVNNLGIDASDIEIFGL